MRMSKRQCKNLPKTWQTTVLSRSFHVGEGVAIVTIYLYIYSFVVAIFKWFSNCLLGRSGVVPLAAARDAGLVSSQEVESVDLGLKWGGEWW